MCFRGADLYWGNFFDANLRGADAAAHASTDNQPGQSVYHDVFLTRRRIDDERPSILYLGTQVETID